ncbi:hypothetical protein [Nonomuraea insulae]|uniref:Trypsin n=1 Tax=Nonomuraea insulae TaxID=1616787 RepID=A0ABW1D7R9_9ACTN
MEGPAGATTMGKVFFIGSDLQPHWCTGTAVQSQYRNLVATTGHCLVDTEAPIGALGKWVFVPGYLNGITTRVSDTDGDSRYDTGISPCFDSQTYGIYRRAAVIWSGTITRLPDPAS